MGNNSSSTEDNISTIIEPVPVNENGVTLSLQSPPFLGYPQEIQFSRNIGIGSQDYIEYFVNNQRSEWHWCKQYGKMVFDVKNGESRNITVKYLCDGSTFSPGKLATQMKYTLRTPLKSFHTDKIKEIGELITTSCDLFIIPPYCSIILRQDGVRLSQCPVNNLQEVFSIQCPRLPGYYETAVIATNDGSTSLRTDKIQIKDSNHNASTIIKFRSHADDQKILVNRCHQLVEMVAIGRNLTIQDKILVMKSDQLFVKPSTLKAQIADYIYDLDSEGKSSISFDSEGSYHLCIGLIHESGVYLLGDWCTLIVTDRVGLSSANEISSIPTKLQTILKQPSLSSRSFKMQTSSAGSSYLCTVCQDKTICMKLEPCRHVCLCEGCSNIILQQGNSRCPICREKIEKMEKIFLC